MPRVPTYDTPQVAPSALPGVRQAGSPPPAVDVQGPAARQNLILGQQVERAGDTAARLTIQVQDEANQLRVDDAMNRARERVMQYTYDPQNGYLSIKGEAALSRAGGRPLAVEYSDKLAEDFGKISQSLGNDAQRSMFAKFGTETLGRFQGQVMQHEAGEYRTYRQSVREGTINNRTNEIALNYNNPQVVTEGIASIKAAVWDLGRMQGWSAEKVEAEQRKATSRAHRSVLLSALQRGDLTYADSYLRGNLRDMEADDILRAGGLVTEGVDMAVAHSAANSTLASYAPRLAPSDTDRAFSIAVGTESGGKQFKDYGYGKRADGTTKGRGWLGELKRPDGNVSTELSIGVEIDGKEVEIPSLVPGLTKKEIDATLAGDMPESVVNKAVAHAKKRMAQGKSPFADPEPLTSSAGAIGIAQVMPGTGPEAARLAGLPWDEDRYKNDPEYNYALGKAYFGEQLKNFDGNLAKAYAAYNAGARWVTEATSRAQKATAGTQEADWFWQLNNDKRAPENRQQTQAYVTKNMREYTAGLGGGDIPSLAEMKADLRKNPSLAGNPNRLKAAETALESQYKDLTAAITQREDKAVDTVLRALYANGGNLDAVDPSLRAELPGNKLSAVMSFAEKVAKGPVNDAGAWAQILSMPQAELARLSPADFYAQFRTVLDDTHLEKGYALIQAAQGNPDEKHLEIITTAQRVKQAAQSAKIIPTDGSKADEDQLQAFGQFSHAIDGRVRQFERIDLEGKRKANSEELQKIIDTALIDTVNVSNSWWLDKKDQPVLTLSPDDAKDAYVVVGGKEIPIGSIPPGQRVQITEALRARGRPITEQAIAALWVAAGKPKD